MSPRSTVMPVLASAARVCRHHCRDALVWPHGVGSLLARPSLADAHMRCPSHPWTSSCRPRHQQGLTVSPTLYSPPQPYAPPPRRRREQGPRSARARPARHTIATTASGGSSQRADGEGSRVASSKRVAGEMEGMWGREGWWRWVPLVRSYRSGG